MELKEYCFMKGINRVVLRDAVTGEIISDHTYENLIVTVAKNMIADRLAQTGNDCTITYGAVGTNATAPVAGNTTLGTEVARNILSVITSAANVVTAVTFFGASQANATLTEFSLFGEAATGSADTGTMINHSVISEVKTSSETLTIETSITIN